MLIFHCFMLSVQIGAYPKMASLLAIPRHETKTCSTSFKNFLFLNQRPIQTFALVHKFYREKKNCTDCKINIKDKLEDPIKYTLLTGGEMFSVKFV